MFFSRMIIFVDIYIAFSILCSFWLIMDVDSEEIYFHQLVIILHSVEVFSKMYMHKLILVLSCVFKNCYLHIKKQHGHHTFFPVY